MPQVFLGVGSNTDREKYIRAGLEAIAKSFGWRQRSRIFRSESVGFSGSDFYNLVVEVETSRSVTEVLAECKRIEQQNGRVPESAKYSPRTLDIDVLLYDDVIRAQQPQLPRAEILENAFVLWPLAEIAGDLLHPVLEVSYQQLWEQYQASNKQAPQQLEPLENTGWLEG
ncbi:2-amino-4-hydroxy-6-hydroxymethyldihydropteridine diphosphokinase [Idiomarina abyssalis]|uniref:2-amino-4-hydroxy-6-hydroxymethyldihydropteridine diphosphokinase n=1 Tax=Idiomarina abyssalis TaxID=86102 RepID=A0A8I1GDY7_9GAMM|nr:2-amino-4-hydroxy-6-hydroxymethyldihydropteridine diphosphokinase [Idiomarina abyssalis]MBJ7267874.1 2-amino-4-hydroxy-6-hydroxymethyldihydropteridine diphosphokinase [Idiomarina abyssalis]MBJ7274241.1 2-amino-4-hydroxy-6-hydroxymethyldihydropteridine diphosphokinase [Idiomarina abyssalis]MBJ7317052.1 2-amino-4-hydroxy-6-hydroxymethyldihydropteridine diphosphokinase [Idiomarina abyssalis]